ncbi:glycoside hydrolase family 13 domain protein [Alkalidesulfovibrio alkalitolerans DSM 16529]|jgi:hypothetical protein|uniref:Glycoside hydrolase family 13 domain protein n=1 Tax=Alkalidesulfovibrio alkalitolerans DSM 16529 TaxID=1121439 RepID=S7TEP7_9BACT|nr:glycoside hydrolase family 13 [Alkalidesulfovibrio alkalitolerans]EPR35065.1 glycoside hydrolase family 13 domain protein [Alkalidesulfovibrio alkalitolerans DSM 16529]
MKTVQNTRNNDSDVRLAERLRTLANIGPGDDFTARVMERIAAKEPLPEPEPWPTRLMCWLMTPRMVSLRPLHGLTLAACLLLAVGGALRFGGIMTDVTPPEGRSPVRFVLAAPGAREVAVIGSFNGWNAAGWTMRHDAATGLWTLTAALPPGSHEYVFLLDGAVTLPDPTAAISADDGFGSRNSVLLVRTGNGATL